MAVKQPIAKSRTMGGKNVGRSVFSGISLARVNDGFPDGSLIRGIFAADMAVVNGPL